MAHDQVLHAWARVVRKLLADPNKLAMLPTRGQWSGPGLAWIPGLKDSSAQHLQF